MLFLMIVGLIVMAIGKIKLSKNFSLVGKPARIYGALVFLIAYPISLALSIIVSTFPGTMDPQSVNLVQLGVVFGTLFGTMGLFEREPPTVPAPRMEPKKLGFWLLGFGALTAVGYSIVFWQIRRSGEHDLPSFIIALVSATLGIMTFVLLYFWIRSLLARKSA
jgi:hypothetical protein